MTILRLIFKMNKRPNQGISINRSEFTEQNVLSSKVKDVAGLFGRKGKGWFSSTSLVISALLINTTGALSGQSFTQEEYEWLELVGSLRFSEVDWEPLSYASDYPLYTGLIADYLDIISQETGIEMVFEKSDSWQEVLNKFRDREIDLIPALSINDYVDAEVVHTMPFVSFPLVIVTGTEWDFIKDTADLTGFRVGVGEGYTSHNFLKINYPEITLVTTGNVPEGLGMVESGEIDAFVGHMAVVIDSIKRYRFNLHIAGKTEYVFDHRIGLPSGHEQTALLFNRVISRITPEEHNRIYNRWIKLNTGSVNYSMVYRIMATSLIIIAAVLIWNWNIATKNRRIEMLLRNLQTMRDDLETKNRELGRLVVTDRLTGLNNRVKLDDTLCRSAAMFDRYGQQYSVILLDVDHFKKINDIFGHLTGDMILVEMSRLLKSHIRSTDTIGRWGGEEFLIICPGMEKSKTKKMAEKLRLEIETFPFPEGHRITASFGVAEHREHDSTTELLKRADEALYEAKKNGRNSVVAH